MKTTPAIITDYLTGWALQRIPSVHKLRRATSGEVLNRRETSRPLKRVGPVRVELLHSAPGGRALLATWVLIADPTPLLTAQCPLRRSVS